MAFIDILSLILSFGIAFSLRCLFPRNIVPLVSTSFEEAMAHLERAETIDIPYVSEYRAELAMYAYLYPLAVQLPADLTPVCAPNSYKCVLRAIAIRALFSSSTCSCSVV
jgi:hypothetical protein